MNANEVLVWPFTRVGATTEPGMLSQPLLRRFLVQVELEPYTEAEITQIIIGSAKRLATPPCYQPTRLTPVRPASRSASTLKEDQHRLLSHPPPRRRSHKRRPPYSAVRAESLHGIATAGEARAVRSIVVLELYLPCLIGLRVLFVLLLHLPTGAENVYEPPHREALHRARSRIALDRPPGGTDARTSGRTGGGATLG